MPGHSRGSLFYVHWGLSVVFTGDARPRKSSEQPENASKRLETPGIKDSFADWGGPTGFPYQCHYDRRQQAASLRGFARTPFAKHIMPSHGQPMRLIAKNRYRNSCMYKMSKYI